MSTVDASRRSSCPRPRRPAELLQLMQAGQVPSRDRRRRVRRHRRPGHARRPARGAGRRDPRRFSTVESRCTSALADGAVRVHGSPVDEDLNDLLDSDLPEGDWDTVGGLDVQHARPRADRGRARSTVEGLSVLRRAGPGPAHRPRADHAVSASDDQGRQTVIPVTSDERRRAHSSGFVTIVGRPTWGSRRSLNRIVGTKVSIVSDKPQTTRDPGARGRCRSPPDHQIVFVDTPGLHKPRTALGERTNGYNRREPRRRRRGACSCSMRGPDPELYNFVSEPLPGEHSCRPRPTRSTASAKTRC